jgi:hypothetical protein
MSQTYIPVGLRRRVAEQARYRCGYSLTAESIVGARMQVDHLHPEADGGATVEDNLWLACSACNGHKNDRIVIGDPETGAIVRLFDPRHQSWAEHFRWSEDGCEILGQTPTGRATVAALHLNRPPLLAARRLWVSVGRHSPAD